MHSTKALIRFLRTLAVATLVLLAVPSDAQTQLLHPTNSVWRYQTDLATQQAAGADWVTLGFDDSAWTEGKGLFGNDTGYPYPMNTSIPGLSPIAVYYRSHFTWNGSTAGMVLHGTNYVDDGSIIYLNGVEIARFNMGPEASAGTPEASAPAANPGGYPNVNGGEPVLVRLEIALGSLTNGNPNPLIVGDNIVAVQVHQNGTASSDRVFGLALYGGYIEPCFVNDLQMTNRIILEGRATTFTVSGTCVPAPTFQWYRNIGNGEELILGATGASHTLTNAVMLDSGQYYVKATHPTGTQTSRPAILMVIHDDIPPTLVSARLGASQWQVIAMINEELCVDASACGTDALFPLNWEIVNAANTNEILNILSVAQSALELRFTLEQDTPWKFDTRYIVRPTDFGGGITGIGDMFGWLMDARSSVTTPPAPNAISVRAISGSDLYTFDSAPYFSEFSTSWLAGGSQDASDMASLNTAAQTVNALLITNALPSALGNPPVVSGLALYGSTTRSIVTRPGGVLATVLLARLRNDSGASLGSITLKYDLAVGPFIFLEEVPGHLVYYSLTGVPNSWILIPGISTNGIAGAKSAVVGFGGLMWPAGTPLYLLFVDDNNSFANETAYQIDNFKIEAGGGPPPDTNAPTLLRAVAPNHSTVVLTFSERLSASAATTAPYTVAGATVTAAAFNAAQNEVTLTTSSRAAGTSAVSITGVRDASFEANLIEPNSTMFNLTTVQKVVNWNAPWDYNTNNLDAVPDWTTTGGAGWKTGNGLFGTELSVGVVAIMPTPIATVIPPPNTNNEFMVSYFRKIVTLPPLSAGQSYALGYMVDDGAVFYLDGVEIGRVNMPAGPVAYATNAVTGIDSTLQTLPFTATVGDHFLSVEVHQNVNASSDTLFGANVIVIPTTLPSLSIAQAGTNAVVSWNADSSWALVGSTNITGPYAPVQGAGLRSFSRPVATPTTQFYKLNYVPQP